MVLIKLAAALICFQGQCYPALVGNDTPIGEFPIVLTSTPYPGYGGDMLAFAQDSTGYYAIHRLYRLNPKQHRLQRIQSTNAKDRLITDGCVNIMPEVYERLKDCCSNEKLVIER